MTLDKIFEKYSRHDGVLSKFRDTDLDINDAVELMEDEVPIKSFTSEETTEYYTKKLEGMKVGEEWRYRSGNYVEDFVKRVN